MENAHADLDQTIALPELSELDLAISLPELSELDMPISLPRVETLWWTARKAVLLATADWIACSQSRMVARTLCGLSPVGL